jgi:hypothetical protein
MYNNPKKIGTLTLDAPHDYRKLYEVAAWHTDITVPAGVYDLTATFGNSREVYWVMVRLPGVIRYEYMASLWCGVPYGKGVGGNPEQIGEPAVYHGQSYGYHIAACLAEGKPAWGGIIDIPLVDGLTITTHQYAGGDGGMRTLYGLAYL